MREVDWRINRINKRTNNDMKFNAALNGLELRNDAGSNDKKEVAFEKLTDDQKKAFEIATARAMERKAEEFASRMK